MILLLLQTFAADACPTVATGSTDPLSFDVAQVAIVRQGTRTTFSVSINPTGAPQDFALVQPVPEVLAEEDIRTLDGELFPTLDGYSAPRRVEDAGCVPSDGGGDGGASDGGSSDDLGGVDVEAEYLVGEYRITILSAKESSSLATWLEENGYHLPAGAEDALAAYIDGGSYFLAAKVADEAALADGSPLSPLQISYDSEVFSIPIRLATLNSPGAQDMVIYAITDREDGRVGIANYPEFEVTDRCVWGRPGADDFGEFYTELFNQEWARQDDAAWTMEFEGLPGSCNPCTSVTTTPEDLADLGFVGDYDTHYLTRIHMRYTPAQADQDLALYSSGIAHAGVTAYADDYEQNYSCVKTYCDGSPTPGNEGGDGGSGDGGSWDGGTGDSGLADGGGPDDGGSDDGGAEEEADKGCNQAGGTAAAFAAALSLWMVGRRRQTRLG